MVMFILHKGAWPSMDKAPAS